MSKKLEILELEEADLRAYAVEHGDALAKLLQKMKDKQKPFVLSWNWLGFFLPPVWLAYRRMWWGLAALVGAIVAMGVIEEMTTFNFGNNIGVVFSVLVAMLGKSWVIQGAHKAAREADALDLDWPERDDYLASKGGVSVMAAWITAVVFVGIIGLAIWAVASGV